MDADRLESCDLASPHDVKVLLDLPFELLCKVAASALPPSVTQRDDSPPAARSEPSDAAGRKRPRDSASDNSEPAVYRSMGAVSAYLKGKQASSGAGE